MDDRQPGSAESLPWVLPGAGGEPILGDVHVPIDRPLAAVLLAHGFKGYKDYGFMPSLAAALADAGFIAHRFNFSHSGMTNRTATFERPDLFERDTWNKQVTDCRTIIDAVQERRLAGGGLPWFIFGHSRGGVTALLAAGRMADDPSMVQPAGIITAAAPDRCNSLTPEESARLLRDGVLESPSARTGPRLRIGRAFLEEQLADPAAY